MIWPFNRKSSEPPEAKSLTDPTSESWEALAGLFTSSSTGVAVNADIAMRVPAVNAAVTLVATWESIVEDEHGLKATGRLILDTARGRETHALMKAGALDGLSIGFRTVRDRMDRAKGARVLEEVDLWEISVVTFPSNPDATISGVKHRSTSNFRELVDAINGARRAIA